MKALEDLTIDEVIESAEIYGVGPEETATGIQRWRTAALKYGSEQFQDDPTEYWKRSASVEKDTADGLQRAKQPLVNEILSTLPRDQLEPFNARYQEVRGDPTKMVDDQWAIKAGELNKLGDIDIFNIDRHAPVTLQAEGKDLGTMALRDRGDDTWEALVMPLKEGSKPFALQIPKPNAEQLQERIGQTQKEYDYLAEAAAEPGTTESETLNRSLQGKFNELELLKSGDVRTLALNDAQKLIKADDAKMEQLAERSPFGWDRFQEGLQIAAVGTGRAMRAYGIDRFLGGMMDVAGVKSQVESYPQGPGDPFKGFEESLAQTSEDTARAFQPTGWETVSRAAATSGGQMAATVLPAAAATRLAGGVVSELGAASAMGPMSAGQEWSQMLKMADEYRARGNEEEAKRLESFAGVSGLVQAGIDVLTEGTFGETARAFRGGRQALTNLVTAPAKEAVEELEAGVAERGIKQPLLYPQEKVQPTFEGSLTEMAAGALAGGGLASVQTLLGGVLSKPKTQQEQIETQRRMATGAAPDAGTAQKVDEIHERAKDWDILNQRRAAPPVYAPPEEAPVETPVEPLEEVKEESLTTPAGEVSTPPPAVEEEPVSPPAEEPITPPPDAIQEPGTETETLRDQPTGGEGVRVEDTEGQEVTGEGAPEETEALVEAPAAPAEEPVPPVPVQRVEEESGFSAPLVEPQPTVEPSVEQAEVTPEPPVEEPTTAPSAPEVEIAAQTAANRQAAADKVIKIAAIEKAFKSWWNDPNRTKQGRSRSEKTSTSVRLGNLKKAVTAAGIDLGGGMWRNLHEVNDRLSKGQSIDDLVPTTDEETVAAPPTIEQQGDIRYSVTAPQVQQVPAQPITPQRATRVAAKTFNGRVPNNVTFVNDPNARTPEGKSWAGRANRANGQITINLAFVQDEADLEERLKEEAVHLVYQDPAVQTAVANLEKAVTGEMLQGVAKLGYDPSVQTEEAAVRLVQQLGENPDTRGLLRKLYEAVANAFRKLFRMEPSRSQVEAAARQVMVRALAGRATTGTSADVRYADAVDAEYMAAHEAGDVGTMQRIVGQVARLAGFNSPKVFHGTEKQFNEFDPSTIGRMSGSPTGGFWFSDNQDAADYYHSGEELGGRTIAVFLRMENPLRVSSEEFSNGYPKGPPYWLNKAVSEGRDGVIIEDIQDGDMVSTVYAVQNPNQIKSADPVVTDDQGGVIPPSQRFDLTSTDIRYSLSEVFGQQTAQPTKGDSYKAAETIAKAQFFDGDRPIDPQATFEATSEIYGWSAATVARLLAMGQGQTNTGEDSKAIVGKGQVELFRYAFRLAQTGDSSLLDHINVYAPKWVQLTGLGENMTAEELATYLGSRASGLEKSATMQAAVGVGSTREEAETKNLPKEFVDDVDAEIRKTKLTPAQVKKVKDDATNAQGTSIAQTVQDLADEVPEEDKTALGYIDRIDKSQVEFIPAPPKPNPVRDYIKKQEDLQTQRPKDDFIRSTIAGLEHLGVSPHVARETTERVWLVHEARRDAKVKPKDINTGVEAFISRADEEQTETRIPPKEKNIAVQTIQAAVANRDAAVEEDEFRKALTADLRGVGVTHSNAVNAAARAWQVRQTQMANEARKAAAAAQARNSEVAEQILGTLAKLQSDTPSLQPAQVNPVRELIRRAMVPMEMWQKSDLTKALEDLNVEPSLAARLTDAVWTQRQNNAQATVAQVQRGLAEGTRGSLKPLEDALIAAPATKQQHPGWRHKTAVNYFTQLGLNPQQAAAAARIYDQEFAARLQDALEGAIEKVASTRAPWAPHAPEAVRKRAKTDLDKLRDAVRTGVADPNSNWHFDLARSNGWKGFTPEQFKRLAVIDDHLFDEDLAAFKKAELKQEVINMVRQAGLPPVLIDYIAASFGISGLTGLPTFFVQLAGPVNLIYKWFNDFPTNPVVSTRTLLASMQTFVAELKHALKTGVFTHQVGENLSIGSIEPLEHLLEKGIENYEKGGAKAAVGLFQIIVGAEMYAAWGFNAIDQASYAAAKIYSQTLFTARELRQLNWTREAAGAFVLDALEGRQSTYDQLIGDGMSPEQAQITADEDFTRILNGRVPGMEDIASNEALGPIGRMGVRPEALGERTHKGRTDQPGQRLKVHEEGLFRRPVGAIIHGIDALLAQGGTSSMSARATFGYIKIPFNAAVWLSNYTAYGYVRLGIDYRLRNQGKETLWKQSMGHRAQIQQRVRDATAGTIMQLAMLGLGLLAGSSGDDDEDKSELKIYFTGRGPDDKTQRQAWMKKFKPYAATLKMGKMYVPINLGRMFETLGWQAALAAAVDDMRLNAKHGSPSFNQVASLIGSYIGSLTTRSSFQGISMDLGGRQTSSIPEQLAHKGIFAASSIVPWKGAVMSLSRMIKDPPDQKTLTGMIEANTPFLYFLGKPSLNVYGDTIRDASFSGIAYREGIPLIPRFPTSKRDRVFYDLVLKHGRGPSIIDNGDVSKFQGVTNEKLYNYGRIRGQMMKKEIIDNAAEWNAYDEMEYRQALEQMARAINPEAAEKAGLERAWE